jgi:formylglycine-generating enzyme required for sulfatase activity
MMRRIANIALTACLWSVAVIAGAQESKITPGGSFRDCEVCPEMVVIPPGSYTMGSPAHEKARGSNEGPQHRINFRYKFAVGKFEVTQREWRHVMGSNPSRFKDDRNPVEKVSWHDAQAFVSELSRISGKAYRLLSESEWEYVARAGTATPFYTGVQITTKQANFNGIGTYNGSARGNNRQATTSVGSFHPNRFGVYDMHGNVWEWIDDCWYNSYDGAPSDGSTWSQSICSVRVLRGGAWTKFPKDLRSAKREGGIVTLRYGGIGFRVARTLSR